MDEGYEENDGNDVPTTPTDNDVKEKKKKNKGVVSRMWNAIFSLHEVDFEKRLKYIHKEEVAILARIKKRSQCWGRMTRHLIMLSVISEVIAVGYAIMTTRSLDKDWKMRALRVLPMFILPFLSFLAHSVVGSLIRMRERKDQKILEKLRAERQAKIDELKEKTNYYTTQQLIQRYDPDPAAKAAAATVLASRLGAESGLKVHLGNDGSTQNAPTGSRSGAAESSGLRHRKQKQTTSRSPQEEILPQLDDSDGREYHRQVIGPYNPSPHEGGWLARLAALLVGEDPTQCYALICCHCHMHNGLARKEDFPYIAYYCAHCKTFNEPKHMPDLITPGSSLPPLRSISPVDEAKVIKSPTAPNSSRVTDSISTSPSSSPLAVTESDISLS
ncbi:unnamed protein product [Cuscuta epithymum]|uniref:Lunapark zinc ribbon domain-containing protein n=1 Tax=Cuscuta epithymum TaxID=186058 RepID=A0AAV0CI75_9ASTE|nr:unnamed protein product [Cuscuta epithymum]